ncbi:MULTISPECIES: 2,4'-dihydroxyacetophenone dioxygenase family protein [unclassified Pseudonocardia]|uniref:2,4'-dihydroxyacetophenone dioxygenase family protein n=1 Tax=unclassified Pseudonocardia TaxID=2619320 RepID=UPI001CF6C1F1|nr:2,4'-dihydroxyacetophenone dioxygenase family protein [Pseudonocardia sp. ICBG601]
MPQSTGPAPVRTSSGAEIPIVSLPQTELLSVNEADIELVRDALGEGISFKPLRLDLERNEWVVIAQMAPGTRLPVHYHTGPVDLLTMAGSWHYLEYPDQPQTAGSYLYEPGGSVHTLVCPETNTEDTLMFVRVSGSNVNFNEDGSFHSILDTLLLRHLTDTLAKEPPNYIEGGEAGLTESPKRS